MKNKRADINFWTVIFILALLFLVGGLIFLLAAKGKLDFLFNLISGLFGP